MKVGIVRALTFPKLLAEARVWKAAVLLQHCSLGIMGKNLLCFFVLC